jgi:hypothetical protein
MTTTMPCYKCGTPLGPLNEQTGNRWHADCVPFPLASPWHTAEWMREEGVEPPWFAAELAAFAAEYRNQPTRKEDHGDA